MLLLHAKQKALDAGNMSAPSYGRAFGNFPVHGRSLTPLRSRASEAAHVRLNSNPQAAYGSSFVAADCLLAGFTDPLKIACVPTPNADGVVDAIAEPVREDGVVHLSVTAVFLRDGEMLVGGFQSLY